MKRGRPAHPDLLTPREWEVLALVREGLTNGQIAMRLGISESGARFHVSEILSKLGVSSREEAAAWQAEPPRRWSMLWPVPVFSGLRKGLGFAAIPFGKASAVALASTAVLAAAIGGLGILAAMGGGESTPAGGADRISVLVEPCGDLFTAQCGMEVQQFTTVEKAAAVASFRPSLPSYIPAAFTPFAVKVTRPQGWAADIRSGSFEKGCPGCDPRMSHNDQIGVYYRNVKGQKLVVMQGFPAYFQLYERAAEDQRGMLLINGREAFWVRGLPGRFDSDQLALYFELGRVGTGWERGPDGTVLFGSPMSYSVTSNGFPLEELIKIAQSVSFD